eukprot:1146729-Pelagomonas_calceolata.AAC.3
MGVVRMTSGRKWAVTKWAWCACQPSSISYSSWNSQSAERLFAESIAGAHGIFKSTQHLFRGSHSVCCEPTADMLNTGVKQNGVSTSMGSWWRGLTALLS